MTTDAARIEVRKAVDTAVDNLKSLAEKRPDAPVTGSDFNKLLSRARVVFPELAALADISEVEGGTTMGELVFKLSVVQGAIHSWYSERTRRAAEAHNTRIERERRIG